MDGYEEFKSEIFKMTKIDLSAYKEKQMKRRIDTLIGKYHVDGYKEFVIDPEAINRLRPDAEKPLRERMGHTRVEIAAGIATGCVVAWALNALMG